RRSHRARPSTRGCRTGPERADLGRRGGRASRGLPGAHGVTLLEDYGLVGDLQTAALVSRSGSIDWLCFPRFDSGACFAALLGDERNGHWSLRPAGDFRPAGRRYREDTLILETEFETADGIARLIDFMPPRDATPDLVRIVEGVKGRVEMRMD